MIVAGKDLPGAGTMATELCIIGAGPAGISLALEVAGAGIDVILIAGGGLKADAAQQALYAGEVADPALHSPTTEYRHRELGGSSVTWGGRCMPFDPIDFEPRSWIEGARWPIAHDEVARFYPAANALVEAGDFIYDARRALPGGMRPMIAGFEPEAFDCDAIERFSPPTNFGVRYRHRLAGAHNIRVLLDAHGVEIVPEADGDGIAHTLFRTLDGKAFSIRAKAFVVATGGIEAARVLLASRAKHPGGIGNAHDRVGRNYLCHIAGTIGDLALSVPSDAVFHGYEQAWDGVYCRRRMALRPEHQRAHGLGNVVLRLHHPRLPDPAHGRGILSAIYLAKPFISYEYARRLHGAGAFSVGLAARHACNVAGEPLDTARFLLDWARRRTFAARKFPSLIVAPRNNRFSLDVHAEQVPNDESRVTLGAARDAFDRPQVRIDWRYKPQDLETVRVALALLKRDLARWGGGTLTYDETEIAEAMLREGAYGGHHIGTTRMAASPETGVVDADCRVFGTSNLFVAGSGVFPTSSQANPTLTIVALALRLGAHLRKRLAPARAEIVRKRAGASAAAKPTHPAGAPA